MGNSQLKMSNKKMYSSDMDSVRTLLGRIWTISEFCWAPTLEDNPIKFPKVTGTFFFDNDGQNPFG